MIVHIWKRESIEKKKIPEKLKLIFRDKPEPKMKNVLSVILRRIITLSDILRLKSCFYFWILYTSDFSAGTRKRIVDINTVFRNITEMCLIIISIEKIIFYIVIAIRCEWLCLLEHVSYRWFVDSSKCLHLFIKVSSQGISLSGNSEIVRLEELRQKWILFTLPASHFVPY